MKSLNSSNWQLIQNLLKKKQTNQKTPKQPNCGPNKVHLAFTSYLQLSSALPLCKCHSVSPAVLFFFLCQHATPDGPHLDKPSTFHIVPMGTRPEHSKTGRVHSGTVTAVTGGYVGINLGVVLAEPIRDLRYSCAFSSPKVLFTLQIPLMLTIILFDFNGDLVKIALNSPISFDAFHLLIFVSTPIYFPHCIWCPFLEPYPGVRQDRASFLIFDKCGK